MIDKLFDVSLELLELAKVFQDRKVDRLQARANRRREKARSLEGQGKWNRAAKKHRQAEALDLRIQYLRGE